MLPENAAKRKMEKIHVNITSGYKNELIPVWLKCLLCGYQWQAAIDKTYKCPKCGSN